MHFRTSNNVPLDYTAELANLPVSPFDPACFPIPRVNEQKSNRNSLFSISRIPLNRDKLAQEIQRFEGEIREARPASSEDIHLKSVDPAHVFLSVLKNGSVEVEIREKVSPVILGQNRKFYAKCSSDLIQAVVDANQKRILTEDEIYISPEDVFHTKDGRKIPLSCYTSVEAPSPSLPVERYLERLIQYINCSAESMIIMLVLLERYINAPSTKQVKVAGSEEETLITLPLDWINDHNIHRLMLTSLMIAAKLFDDHVYNNAMWANVGGVAVKELNTLESEFYAQIDYKLSVTNREFQEKYFQLLAGRDRAATERLDSSSALRLASFFLMQNSLRFLENEESVAFISTTTILTTYLILDVCSIVADYLQPSSQEDAYIEAAAHRCMFFNKSKSKLLSHQPGTAPENLQIKFS